MSAHWRPFRIRCDKSGCNARVAVEVFNTYNASQGRYCRRHGDKRVKELLAGERKDAHDMPSGAEFRVPL